MRARMAIAISGQQVEFREVILRDKPPSMIELSPKGTVPVLSLSSGCLLYTSPSPRDLSTSRMPSSA